VVWERKQREKGEEKKKKEGGGRLKKTLYIFKTLSSHKNPLRNIEDVD